MTQSGLKVSHSCYIILAYISCIFWVTNWTALDEVLTNHEFWEVDSVIALVGIMISQQSIVAKFPSKRIGNDDNDASDWTILWFDHVCLEAVAFGDLAARLARVDVAAEASGTRHGRRFLVRKFKWSAG